MGVWRRTASLRIPLEIGDWPIQMPDLTIDGLRLHWEEFGPEEVTGLPVVLLHGLGSSCEDWQLQVPVLGRRHRILAPDLPGHGRSEGFRGWPRMETYAGVVRRLLEQADASPAHLVGLSLGGAIALQLALDSPRHVASVVAVNTLARFLPRATAVGRGFARLGFALSGRMDAVAEWVAAELFPEPEQAELRQVATARLAANQRSAYLQALAAAVRFNVRRRLGAIDCPALIVAGEIDPLIPLERQREIAKEMDGARLAIVPGSRHATPIDSAETFNQIVLAFLEEVEERGSGQGPVVSGQSPARSRPSDH